MPSVRTYLTLAGLGIAAIGGFALYRNAGGIADWIEGTGRSIGQRLGTIPNLLPTFTAPEPIDIWGSLFGSSGASAADSTVMSAPPGTQPPEDFTPPAVIDPADSRTWPPGYVPPADQDFMPPAPAVPNEDPEETAPPMIMPPANEDPEETELGPPPMVPNQDPEETRNLYESIFEARPNYESYSDPLQNRLLSNFFRSQGFGDELDALYSRYGNFESFSAGLQNRLLENRARSIGV